MRKRNLAIVSGLVVFFFSAATALPGQKIDLKPGEWEIHVKMEIPGMPFPMPPTTVKQCMTADEPVPAPKSKDQECTYKDMEISGNTAKWRIECKMQDGNTMQGDGEVTYSGTTMSGTQTLTSNEVNINSSYTGKWIGPCKK